MVEAFAADAPHPSLGNRVRARRPPWSLDHTHALGREDRVEWAAELRVPVVDHTVSTVKKSHARMPLAWARRNSFQDGQHTPEDEIHDQQDHQRILRNRPPPRLTVSAPYTVAGKGARWVKARRWRQSRAGTSCRRGLRLTSRPLGAGRRSGPKDRRREAWRGRPPYLLLPRVRASPPALPCLSSPSLDSSS
jgi:hypothetical protein